jgi:hypothetical protein
MNEFVTRAVAVQYRKKASDLRRLALKVEDETARDSIERVAKRWEARAEAAEAEDTQPRLLIP